MEIELNGLSFWQLSCLLLPWVFGACGGSQCPAVTRAGERSMTDAQDPFWQGVPPEQRARSYYNFALTSCLSVVSSCEADKADAEATLTAYLQQGGLDVEFYHKLNALADRYAARSYGGSIPGEFRIKKCIDLYESNELRELVDGALAEEARRQEAHRPGGEK